MGDSLKKLSNEIYRLEELLLHSDMRSNPEKFDELLAPEFEEISPTGQVTSRESVISWLLNKDTKSRWDLHDFQLKKLSQELVLVSYKAKQVKPEVSTSLGSLRSSIWRKNVGEETWRMVFHQATKIL